MVPRAFFALFRKIDGGHPGEKGHVKLDVFSPSGTRFLERGGGRYVGGGTV